jgi:hypothetical protein
MCIARILAHFHFLLLEIGWAAAMSVGWFRIGFNCGINDIKPHKKEFLSGSGSVISLIKTTFHFQPITFLWLLIK